MNVRYIERQIPLKCMLICFSLHNSEKQSQIISRKTNYRSVQNIRSIAAIKCPIANCTYPSYPQFICVRIVFESNKMSLRCSLWPIYLCFAFFYLSLSAKLQIFESRMKRNLVAHNIFLFTASRKYTFEVVEFFFAHSVRVFIL